MDDDAAIVYYAKSVPVDHSLLAPLGLMTWAAIRLHFTIRDTLGIHLGTGLSDVPFNSTLGGAVSELVKTANNAGDPWATSIAEWANTYGRPAAALRDRVTHSVAYTAPDGLQALKTSPDPRHPPPERVTEAFLEKATGRLVLAAVRLGETRAACRSRTTS
jgi:hypothetical protein